MRYKLSLLLPEGIVNVPENTPPLPDAATFEAAANNAAMSVGVLL